MLRQYEVTFYLRRKVTVVVDCDSGEDPQEYAYDQLNLQEDEEVDDCDISESDPNE